jgi:hypothetical protein
VSAAIGVAKGIQFLHGGIMPGLFGNNLKITNVLLDHNLVAKIGSYNIPILAKTTKSEVVLLLIAALSEPCEENRTITMLLFFL